MKRKTLKIIAALAAASIMLTACGQNNGPNNAIEFGDIETSETNDFDTDEDKPTEVGLPTYDPTSATQALEYTSDRKLETKDSYYKDQLGERAKKAFDSIYYATEHMMQSVELETSQAVTPTELENIMHILFLDCPEIFWVDNAFSYTTKEDGYVKTVSFYYTMTQEQVDRIKDDNASDKPKYIQLLSTNDYDSVLAIIKGSFQTNVKWENVTIKTDGSYDFSCNNPFNDNKNSVGNSKLITYWLRECGLDCTVAVGELVSETLSDDYELTTDYMNFREVDNSEGFYTIRYNYSCYWVWNLIKIDDQWYNFDFSYSFLLNEKFRDTANALWFVTDLTMSQTRLSYMNEEILGIMPSCTDVNFQPLYRSGNYILSMNEVQVLKKLQEIISTCDAQNEENVMFQCADEQTFNYIMNNIDEQIENYNKTYGNPIGSYKTVFVRDSLIFSLKDIIYNY